MAPSKIKQQIEYVNKKLSGCSVVHINCQLNTKEYEALSKHFNIKKGMFGYMEFSRKEATS